METGYNALGEFLLELGIGYLCPDADQLSLDAYQKPLFRTVSELAGMMPGRPDMANLREIVTGKRNADHDTQKAMEMAVWAKLQLLRVSPEAANKAVREMATIIETLRDNPDKPPPRRRNPPDLNR